MFKIELAGVVIEIDNINNHVKEYCKDWLTDASPNFRVKVTNDEIDAYVRQRGVTPDVAERVLLYRLVYARLTEYGKFLLHSGAISYKGNGVAFVASRGVGKTTHAMLWKHTYWNDVEFINGDKPLISIENGKIMAYSTPWRGKECLGEKICAPLSAIVFLERGETPEIKKISVEEAVTRMANQTIAPLDRSYDKMFADNIALMLKSLPLYAAKVNTDKESAIIVKDYIFK